MELNISNVILVVGLIQGLAIIIATLKQKAKNLSHWLFALILLILTFATFGQFRSYELEPLLLFQDTKFRLGYFPYFLFMILGPVIFFYCKSLLESSFKFRKVYWIHFCPLICEVFPFLDYLITTFLFQFGIIGEPVVNSTIALLDQYQIYIEIPRALSITFYLVLSWKYVLPKKSMVNTAVLKWIKTILVLFSIVNIIYLILLMLLFITPQIVSLDQLQSLLVYMIYYPFVGIIYYFTMQFMLKKIPWATISIGISEIEEKAIQLRLVMKTEKIYLNPELKLKDVEDKTGIPVKTISFVLNNYFEIGFNDFVNSYRIQQAIEKINSGVLVKKTLEGLAYEVGFSSRTTFYRAFKKVTSNLPSDYLKK